MSKTLSQSKHRSKPTELTRWLLMGGCLLVAQGTISQDLVSASSGQHYASTYQRQNVTPIQTQSLKMILSELETRFQVRFVYESNLIDQKQLSTLISEGKTLTQCLDQLLTPLKLSYQKLDDHTYGIVKKQAKSEDAQSSIENSLELSLPNIPTEEMLSTRIAETSTIPLQALAIIVTGKVTDEKGEGIPGVNVVLKGTTTGTSTNMTGDYTLSVPDESANGTLIFSYIGYLTEEVAINSRTAVSIQLAADIKSLNEVVVIGYGTQRKQDLTGAVAIVKTADLEKVQTNDIGKVLQGRAAGVTVTGSGEPGASPIVKIRGVASLGTNTSPLYVVDGVPLQGGIGDFSPNDIESVQVLKDASAAGIYGSRAANGVIIITTKRGKKSPLKVSYNGYLGTQYLPKHIPVTNREQYQQITSDAERNATVPVNNPVVAPGNAPTIPDPNDPTKTIANPLFIGNVDTDWQKEAFKNGKIMDHALSFSGGNEASTYNISTDYFSQTGNVQGPGPKYDRYSFRVNSQTKAGRFKVGESIYYSYSNQKRLTGLHVGNTIIDIVKAIPTMAVYDPNRLGGYGGADKFTQRAITLNVIGENNLITSYGDRYRFFGNFWGELEIVDHLTYKLNLSYDRTDWRDVYFRPKYDLGWFFANDNAEMSDQRGAEYTGLVENTLNYNNTFGKHKIDALIGTMYQARKWQQIRGAAQGFSEPYFMSLDAGTTNKTVLGSENQSNLISYLGRINYSFDDRYLLTVTLRRDGSSRFAATNRWGNFPSVAVAWKLHNEEFFQVPTISSFKLRGSYGALGNQEIGNYGFESTINPNASYPFNGGGVLASGSIQTQYATPNLKWETKISSNIGVDFGLLDEKFQFSAEYYYNKSENLLVPVNIPNSSGADGNPYVNAGSVRNTGVEVTATYNKTEGDFKFDVSGNVSTLNNKVLSLGSANQPLYGVSSKTEVGRSVGELYGYVVEGIFQNATEVKEHAKQEPNTAPGDIKFKDINGRGSDGKLTGMPDGIINADDRTFLGSAIPKVYYGLNFNASYKNFDLTMFIQGHAGNKVVNGVYQVLMRGSYDNHHTDMLNRWTMEGQQTDIPRAVDGDPNNNMRESSRWIQNGTYVRLQNLQIGYTVPQNILSALKHVSRIRVYASAQNLLTLTKYEGYDPDFTSDGLFSRGFDYGSYPTPRTFIGGIQVTF